MVAEILRRKREIIERLKERRGIKQAISEARAAGKNPVITEVKRKGLKEGEQALNVDPVATAKQMAAGGACAISVLTEAAFSGSLRDLRDVKLSVALPVLRKDFIFDEFQVLESYVHGANAILLIARFISASKLNELIRKAASLDMEALVEIDRVSKDMILDMDFTTASTTLIGINNRDLDTLEVDVATFVQIAPEIKLKIPANVPLVAMSGITSKEEARRMFDAGADALLAGTSVMRADEIERKVMDFVSVQV